MIIGPHSKIKLCKYCHKYFTYKHNREMYCCDEHRKYAKQDQWRDSKIKTRKRDKLNGIKKEEEGTIGLGAKREEDPIKELMAVHKQVMIIKGTYTEARFKMEIKELSKAITI